MAWYTEKSVFSFGKYKGKRVSEVDDAEYILWLHNSDKNVYFEQSVLTRLGVAPERINKKPKEK